MLVAAGSQKTGKMYVFAPNSMGVGIRALVNNGSKITPIFSRLPKVRDVLRRATYENGALEKKITGAKDNTSVAPLYEQQLLNPFTPTQWTPWIEYGFQRKQYRESMEPVWTDFTRSIRET